MILGLEFFRIMNQDEKWITSGYKSVLSLDFQQLLQWIFIGIIRNIQALLKNVCQILPSLRHVSAA